MTESEFEDLRAGLERAVRIGQELQFMVGFVKLRRRDWTVLDASCGALDHWRDDETIQE